MKIPVIRGVIERRILVNYRVDAGVLKSILPAPFRPKVVRGVGMVGICLIRLKGVGPKFFPRGTGISSENAAHRAAVEWDDGDAVREGVFVRRRDTNSWLNTLAGGRLFPGMHHHAEFFVKESDDRFDVELRSDDEVTDMAVSGRVTERLPGSSVFKSLDEASEFFRAGSLGYSVTNDPERFEGLELKCQTWQVEPLEVERVRSSFFEDESVFPKGSIEFDCGLLMRGIEHEWHGRGELCCATGRLNDCPSIHSLPVSETAHTARRI